MSASVDTRIVSMKFDNSQFEAGIRSTLASLEALSKGMKLDGATKGLSSASKGLSELSSASRGFTLGPVGAAADSVGRSFSAMSAIALGALATVGNQALGAGKKLATGLFGPVKAGLGEYETNLNAIQTILANTSAAGTSLKDVNGALQELNTYSDQTIYNFSEMAKNIGTFTAAGVDLKTATGSIKGIANLAALSGSNSQQASTAMYQLSQAISSGKVSLQDWNSVVNAGMGGTVFQRALATTAESMGSLSKGSVELKGKMKNVTIEGKSFRESITAKPGEKSWLTSDVLTKTLQQFTGDLKDSDLAAQGFNASQIKAIQAQAKTARNAATQVKTMSQLFGTLKESAGSGWANTWQLIFGDFEQAKMLFTSVNNTLGAFISSSANARNSVLKDWAALGGRTALISAIKNAFDALIAVVTPIKDAFREIFPATTGKQLADISKGLERFTAGLKIGGSTADLLKRTFAGVFAIFSIGFEVIKQVVRVFSDLFSAGTAGSSGFLKTTASVGDFLVALNKSIKSGEGFTKFFDKIRDVLLVPIGLLKRLGSAFAGLFTGLNFGALDGIGAKFKPLSSLGGLISSVWGNILSIFSGVAKVFAPLASKFASFFGSMGSTIAGAANNIDFGQLLSAIQTILLGGLLVIFTKFVKSFGKGVDTIGTWKEALTSPFSAMTGTLEQMQKTLKAAQLLAIAMAIGILAASAVALSKIDSEGLTRALVALTIMFTQLAVAMAVFAKIDIKSGMAQLILVAIALRILTSSVVELSQLSWADLAKGLIGTSVLLAALAVTAQLMPDGKKMISSSIGLLLMAAAIKVLVSAVSDLAGLSWEDMAKGLTGVSVLLLALALFSKFTDANNGGIASGLGLILLATGVKILASAMGDFAQFSWDEIARGLVAMGGGLAIMAAALILIPPTAIFSAAAVLLVAVSLGLIADAMAQMGTLPWEVVGTGLTVMAAALGLIAGALLLLPPSTLLSAAAIFVVASSLGLIASALGTMGGMSWEAIAKGLITLAASLGIIAAAMALMTGALPGAAALVVVAAALTLIAPVLVTLGGMSWTAIAKGLLTLAAALVIIGLAGILLTPAIPTLLGLGIAIGLLGIGVALAGVGVLAFSVALTALSLAGVAATSMIVGIVAGLIGLLPTIAKQIGLAVIAFAKVIGAAGPAILAAITAVLKALLDAIIAVTPRIGQLMLTLIATLLRVLVVAVPMLVQAGANLIVSILSGIAANVGRMVTAAASIIVNFLNALASNLPRIIQAGVNLILAFVNGAAEAVRNNSAAMNAAGRNLASAIVEGMVSGITGGISAVTGAASRLASSALKSAKNVLGIKSPSKEFEKLGKYSAQGFIKGLDGSKDDIDKSFSIIKDLLKDAMDSAGQDVQRLEAKLASLNKERKKDKKAILETSKALAEARAENAKAAAGLKLANTYGEEVRQLGRLADAADVVTDKIKEANKNLEDATKTRDDYSASIANSFDALPDLGKDTTLESFSNDLQSRVDRTREFVGEIQKLRDLGLNDTLYRELLGKGIDTLPFIKELVAAGKDNVSHLNRLDTALISSATSLGTTASVALYQAGVDAARGLVKGLEDQQAAIQKQMDIIADAMVEGIKTKLGIRSPSREFAKIGRWTSEGLAQGLSDSSSVVKATENMGANAILAMRKSLTGIADLVMNEVDVNPTIRPVLDLTDVQKNAGQLNGLFGAPSLAVGSSYSTAANALAEHTASQAALSDAAATAATPASTVTYVQNNNSPKALSSAEIYRQTRNQLSVTKGALISK